MFFNMKTTLNIDEGVMKQLKQEAASRGCTMSELVETAIRSLLRSKKNRPILTPLPTFKGGRERVDVSNRNALYDVMEDL